MTHTTAPAALGRERTEELVQRLYSDGIIGLRGASDQEWVAALAEDVDVAFHEGEAARTARSGVGQRQLQRAKRVVRPRLSPDAP